MYLLYDVDGNNQSTWLYYEQIIKINVININEDMREEATREFNIWCFFALNKNKNKWFKW